jgi:hypothetical protein
MDFQLVLEKTFQWVVAQDLLVDLEHNLEVLAHQHL